MELIEAFEQNLRSHRLIEPGQKVLVAFSGGADSTALLHLFVAVREAWSLEVSAAHLNHQTRAHQSDADEAHCRHVCNEWRVPFFSRRVDVIAKAREQSISLEMAARAERYRFLEEVADAIEADVIALGHTLDDLAETVLLHLARGTGSSGLAGMPIRRDRYIRPLLTISRAQVESYCRQQQLAVVHDETNADLRFQRNRIRHRILPELRLINPRVNEALARLAEVVRAEEEWWQAYLQQLEPQFTLWRTAGEWHLCARWLAQQPVAVQRRVLRYAIQQLDADAEFAHVERLRRAAIGGERVGYTLPGGVVQVATAAGKIRLWQKPDYTPVTYEIVMQLPGETPVPPVGITILAEHSALPNPSQWRRDNWEVWCDAEQIGRELRVRNWQPGDRIQPLGLRGSRKVSDILIDRKVPRHLRRLVPVVCDEEGIVWIVGICLAHRVRCMPQTKETVHLRAEPRREW